MKFILLITALFTFFLAVEAKPNVKTNNKQKEQAESELELWSDKATYSNNEEKIHYSGNVQMKYGNLVIKADSVTAFLDNKGSNNKIKKIEAYGKVKLDQNLKHAEGDKAIFNMVEKKIYLQGNVILKEFDNVMLGDKLIHDLNSNKTDLVSDNRIKAKLKIKSK